MGTETLRDLLLWIIAIIYAIAFLGFMFYMLLCRWKRRHLPLGRRLPQQEYEIQE